MDAKELMKRLAKHPIVVSDMTLQVLLGLPYLEKQNGKLCISFKPHVENVNGDNIEFYMPQYNISWVYPFKHLISFSDLHYYQELKLDEPSVVISLQDYLKQGIFCVEDLYEKCTRVLEFQEIDGTVSDVSIKKYQRAYWEVVQELGLQAVYGDGEI